MRIIWSGALLGGGIGFFGRFIIALLILTVIKSIDKTNTRRLKGWKTLIVLGAIVRVILGIMFSMWLIVFGRMFLAPIIFGYYG